MDGAAFGVEVSTPGRFVALVAVVGVDGVLAVVGPGQAFNGVGSG